MNMNYGWIWIMGDYDLCVNMNNLWIWIMGEYDLCVNLSYGWIWIMGWWGGREHTDIQTETQTDTHINTMTRPGWGAGPSEKAENVGVQKKTRGANKLPWTFFQKVIWNYRVNGRRYDVSISPLPELSAFGSRM